MILVPCIAPMQKQELPIPQYQMIPTRVRVKEKDQACSSSSSAS